MLLPLELPLSYDDLVLLFYLGSTHHETYIFSSFLFTDFCSVIFHSSRGFPICYCNISHLFLVHTNTVYLFIRLFVTSSLEYTLRFFRFSTSIPVVTSSRSLITHPETCVGIILSNRTGAPNRLPRSGISSRLVAF